jgi:hypothetical protein
MDCVRQDGTYKTIQHFRTISRKRFVVREQPLSTTIIAPFLAKHAPLDRDEALTLYAGLAGIIPRG